jgi:hypothetical protein
MLKIENTEVMGWEHAIRGMRNPKNSWEKSDSGYCCGDKKCSVIENCDLCCDIPHFEVGENDFDLMTRLRNAGTDHRKFMRMITVYLDITAPLYWWQMIQLLPSSYNQRRTVMLNYEVLANIYKSRRNHKLDEWHIFCDWIEQLPYSELITGKEEKANV